MKSVIKYSLLFIMFICALLVNMDINSIDTRKVEMQESTQISMRNVLKANSINRMYPMTENDMSAELIRNIAENMNTDSDLRVNVYDISTKGLIDMQLTSTFKHLNGVEDSRTIRRTMITEQYENEKKYSEYNHDTGIRKMLEDKKIALTNIKAFGFDKATGTITGFNSSMDIDVNNGYLVIPKEIEGVEVKVIGSYAFSPYSGDKKIVIPNTIESIDSYAFRNAVIRDLVLPPSIKSIGYNAFTDVTLSKLTFTSKDIPNFETHSLNLFAPTGNLNIYVPKGTLNEYTQAIRNISNNRVSIFES